MTSFSFDAAHHRAGLLLSFALLGAATAQAQPDEKPPSYLWQGLAEGMTPEEALPVVLQIEGVKRAKILKERKTSPERRIDIDYGKDKIPIADLPFELGPRFEGGRLSQVMLAARSQCGAYATRIAEELATGLRSKYTAPLSAPQLSDRDFRQAERSSRTSGEPSGVATAFASDEVAVVLTFLIKVEAPPPYPTSYNKLGQSLWEFANLQYEQRKDECGGTGDRRMDVVLTYMSRSAFNAAVIDANADAADKAEQVADQL